MKLSPVLSQRIAIVLSVATMFAVPAAGAAPLPTPTPCPAVRISQQVVITAPTAPPFTAVNSGPEIDSGVTAAITYANSRAHPFCVVEGVSTSSSSLLFRKYVPGGNPYQWDYNLSDMAQCRLKFALELIDLNSSALYNRKTWSGTNMIANYATPAYYRESMFFTNALPITYLGRVGEQYNAVQKKWNIVNEDWPLLMPSTPHPNLLDIQEKAKILATQSSACFAAQANVPVTQVLLRPTPAP